MSTPTIPSAQAPVAVMPSGAMAREWFVFLAALAAVAVAQDARAGAAEARLATLDGQVAALGARVTALEAKSK